MRIPIIFLASVLTTSTLGAQTSEEFASSFDAEVNLIDLGQGILPNTEIAAPCFLAGADLRSHVASGSTNFFMSIYDGEDSSWSTTSRSSESSMGGGFTINGVGGSASTSSQFKQIREFRRDAHVIRVLLDMRAETLKEYLTDIKLNSLGVTYKGLGPRLFLSNCGALVATQLWRTVRIQALIELTFTSQTSKHQILSSMRSTLGGSYAGFSANASFASSMDIAFGSSSVRRNTTVEAYIRAENGISGLDTFTSALSDLNQKPFTKIIEALQAILKSKTDDKGAVDRVSFQHFDRLVPDFRLEDWTVRRAFWERANRVRSAISRLKYMNAGRFDRGLLDETDFKLRKLAHERTCSALNISPSVEPHGICTRQIDFTEPEVRLLRMLEHCLGAKDTNEAILCSDTALVASLGLLLSDLYPSKFEATNLIAGISPTAEELDHEQKVFSTTRNFLNFLDIATKPPLDVGRIKKADYSFKCCITNRASEILDLFIKFGRDVWSELSRPLSPFGVSSALGRDEGPIPLGSRYAADVMSVWLKTNIEIVPIEIVSVAPNGSRLTMKFFMPDVIGGREAIKYWYGNGADCATQRGGCEPVLSETTKFLIEAQQSQLDVFLVANTALGKQRVFIATVFR